MMTADTETSALDAETEKLNLALVRAEEMIRAMKCNVHATVSLIPNLSMLAWSRRDAGGWGLYTIALSTDEHTTILKASREKRILAAGRIPALVAQMRRVEAAQEIEARQARELLSDWLDRFDPTSVYEDR